MYNFIQFFYTEVAKVCGKQMCSVHGPLDHYLLASVDRCWEVVQVDQDADTNLVLVSGPLVTTSGDCIELLYDYTTEAATAVSEGRAETAVV